MGWACADDTPRVASGSSAARSAGGNAWAARFVEFVRQSEYRRWRKDNIVYLPPGRGREMAVV